MAAGKFLHDLLDLDTYMPKVDGTWPSLKLVFDNLRCYPILAIFGLALGFLSRAPDFLSTLSFWFMLPIFVLLSLAALTQTAVILAVLTVGIISMHVQPGERVAGVLLKREKLVQGLVTAFLVVLSIICFVSTLKLFDALSQIRLGT